MLWLLSQKNRLWPISTPSQTIWIRGGVIPKGSCETILADFLPMTRCVIQSVSSEHWITGRLETAQTRALAWLLGNKERGFGAQLLEALVLHLPESGAVRLTRVERVESEVPIRCGPSLKDAGRIDVLAEGAWDEAGMEASWLLVIEAKIDAGEGEEQLSSYDGWIDGQTHTRKLRVFLTPNGQTPRTGTEWQTLSFLD